MHKLDPDVRRETSIMGIACALACALMLAVFAILHVFWPDTVPFGGRVIVSGILGTGIAWLNFFLMALTVQAAVGDMDEETRRNIIKGSYTRRMGLQMVWVVIALAVPYLQPAAAIIPLLFPSNIAKLQAFFNFGTNEKKS